MMFEILCLLAETVGRSAADRRTMQAGASPG